MAKRKFQVHKPGRGGWCDWVIPVPKGYLMKCCDCGLVHEMDFGVFVEKKLRGRALEIILELPQPFRVKFRARRQRKASK